MDYQQEENFDIDIVKQTAEAKSTLLADLIAFTEVFYRLRTGRDFKISYPISRESHYKIIVRALNRVFYGKCNKLIINVPPRHGKAIHINTKILTKKGWKTAGDVQINDYIVGSNGWTKVIGVFPQGILPSKQIFFDDHQSIICNSDHLWNVSDRYTPKFKTFTTQHIENTLFESDGRRHWRLPIINGNYGEIKPFIDPYLFGCWLGDGTSAIAAITTMDGSIVKAFISKGHLMNDVCSTTCGKAKTYRIVGNGFQTLLRKNNLLNNKHIPDCVFRWSKANRLALLQGLNDTDGTYNKKAKQISFCNKNESIINGFCYLINSLGGTYRIYNIKSGSKNINFRLPNGVHAFRLNRKKKLVPSHRRLYVGRFVSKIIDSEPCEMVCFSVDAKDKLFAVGQGLILTHNTTMLMNFIAWSLARFPDSNFLYVSLSHELASLATAEIRNIITAPYYKSIFNVTLRDDSQAKDCFTTTAGGSVTAVGSGGTITGRGAGLRGVNRFGGIICIDDIIKPSEASSDVIRNSINDWFYNTLLSRRNGGEKTPIVFIGQRTHEDDLAGHLLAQDTWDSVILPAIDDSGNAICPELLNINDLKAMRDLQPYVFSSQYQQNPIPPGGSLFKVDNFPILDKEPKILITFITVDTAETSKEINDATVFSLWGIYKIEHFGKETELYGLHWLNCVEMFVEPKDLQAEFMQFYASAAKFNLPSFACIEKKSTGVTLISVLNSVQGLNVIAVDRTSKSGSKTDRHISMQQYINNKLITLPYGAPHVKMCIDHMVKINAAGTQRRSDIADSVFDAVRMVFQDKTALGFIANTAYKQEYAKKIIKMQGNVNNDRANIWG